MFLAETLADSLHNSLTTADAQSNWKAAVICPIFKKGDPKDVANYRPVSLISVGV